MPVKPSSGPVNYASLVNKLLSSGCSAGFDSVNQTDKSLENRNQVKNCMRPGTQWTLKYTQKERKGGWEWGEARKRRKQSTLLRDHLHSSLKELRWASKVSTFLRQAHQHWQEERKEQSFLKKEIARSK
ncbi:rCG63254 [Rattus norvegicus]|uniref:RCG63254 n=1 Tax=Rattus norvegicus TaxID=10116 RepID=A6JIA1_RAT|nr:rCG63254 [Rattus norvegicus]